MSVYGDCMTAIFHTHFKGHFCSRSDVASLLNHHFLLVVSFNWQSFSFIFYASCVQFHVSFGICRALVFISTWRRMRSTKFKSNEQRNNWNEHAKDQSEKGTNRQAKKSISFGVARSQLNRSLTSYIVCFSTLKCPSKKKRKSLEAIWIAWKMKIFGQWRLDDLNI